MWIQRVWMQALRLYCLLSYQENERNEYSCDYWIDRFSCSIIISYSHFQELFRCSPLGKATGTTASNQIISTGISNAPKLIHWLAAVIRFTRSGDALNTLSDCRRRFRRDPLGQRWSSCTYPSKYTFLMPDKTKLLTTTQTVSFWVGLIVCLSLWVKFLLRWTRDGVIALQPVTLPDYVLIFGLFVAIPLIIIALFVGIAAFVALTRAKSEQNSED